MAITDILKNAGLGAIKTTASAMFPNAATTAKTVKTLGSLYNNSANSPKSQLGSLGLTGANAGTSSAQKLPSLNATPTYSDSMSSSYSGGGYSYAPSPTPDYSNYNLTGNSGSGYQDSYSGGGNNNQNNNYTSGQTTPAMPSYTNPYADQLKALQDKINQYNEGLSQYLRPGQDENDALSQLDALTAQQRNLAASTELGLANIQGKAIPLQFQQGQSAQLQRQAAAQMGALGAQAEPLTTKLARLQASRQNAYEIAKNQLENIKGEYGALQNQIKPLEVGGNLVRLNPTTGQYETIFSAPKSGGEGFTLGEGQMRFDANGNLVASGAPKSPQEQYTNDIKEYNFAKSQGYTGSFTDYQRQNANLKNVAMAGQLNPSQMNAAFKLSDDYEKASGDIQKQISAYNRIVAASKDPSPSGDLALIFSYMKLLDPGSVVREGEFATAQNAGTIGDKVTNMYNKILNGERLSPQQRQDFINRSQSLYNSAVQQQRQVDQTFSGRAQQYGIPSDYVVRTQSSYLDNGGGQNMNQYSSQLRPGEILVQDRQGNIGAISSNEFDPNKYSRVQGFNQPLSMGVKGSFEQKFPDGVRGGQCASFARKLVDIPPLGDGLNDKKAHVDKIGIPANQWRNNPQVGDVVITNENPTYGHVFVVNKVLPNGKIQVTESNYKRSEAVSHDRIVSINSSAIYGAIRAPLKV